jgi:hypothetical protein
MMSNAIEWHIIDLCTQTLKEVRHMANELAGLQAVADAVKVAGDRVDANVERLLAMVADLQAAVAGGNLAEIIAVTQELAAMKTALDAESDKADAVFAATGTTGPAGP